MVHYLHIKPSHSLVVVPGFCEHARGKKTTKKKTKQQQQQEQQQLTEAYLLLPRENEMFEMVSVVNSARV